MNKFLRPRRSILDRAVTCLFTATLSCVSAQGAILTWDADGPGGGVADGGGSWDLAAANWWTGAANVAWTNPGVPDSAVFGSGGTGGVVSIGAAITMDDLTFNNNGYTLSGGTLALAGTPTVTVANGVAATISSNLVGATAWTKAGAGTVTLAGAAPNGLTAGIVVGEGTVRLDTTTGFNGPIAINAAGTLEVTTTTTAADNWRTNSAITGPGTIVKTGAGWFQVQGSALENFEGKIRIEGGRFGNANNNTVWTNSKADVFIAAGAELDLHSDDIFIDELTGSGSVVNTSNSDPLNTLTVGVNNGSSQFDGVIRGAGGGANNTSPDAGRNSLTKVGTGTFTLSGVNTYFGGTTIDGGTLRIAVGDNRLPVTTTLTMNGGATAAGTFDLNGLKQTVGGLIGTSDAVNATIVGGGGTLTVNIAAAIGFDFPGNLTGNLSFTKTGIGTQGLNGTNTYTGPTIISGGALRIGTTESLSPNSNISLNGGVLELAGPVELPNLGTGNGQFQFTGSGGFSAFAGERTISLSGGATLAWGANSFLPVGANLLFGSPTSTDTLTLSNSLDLGGATRTLEVANGPAAIEGALDGTISNGTLIIRGTGSMGITGQITGGLIVENLLTSAATTNVTLNRPGGDAIAGPLQIGGVGATAARFATVRNAAANQIADTTVVNFGSASNAAAYWFLAGFNETVGGLNSLGNGGVIELVETEQSPNKNSVLTLNVAAGTQAFSGILRDRGSGDTNNPGGNGRLSIVKIGPGTQSIATNSNQRWSGPTIVREGVLALIMNNNVTLSAAITIDAATLNKDATLEFRPNASQSFTVSASISGANGATGKATVLKGGAGTTIFTGTNTYAFTTAISGGALRMANAGAFSPNTNIEFRGTGGTGGVLELNTGSFTSPIGTAPGNVRWTGGGGFGAFAQPLMVNIGGAMAALTWGAGGFVPAGAALVLSGPNSDKTTTFLNPIDLAGGSRRLVVQGGSDAIDVELPSTISNGSLTIAPGNSTVQISGRIQGDVAIENGSTGVTNFMQILLNNPAGNAIGGNFQLGNLAATDPASFTTVKLLGPEQIADTGVVSYGSAAGRWSYLNLNGFDETIGGLSNLPGRDGGVVQLVESDPSPITNSTLTLNVASGTLSYLGHIRDRGNGVSTDPGGNGRLNIVKNGAGTQELITWSNQTWTGTTTVNGGTLRIGVGGGGGGGGTLSGQITAAPGATVDFTNGPNLNPWIYNGVLAIEGPFVKSGGGLVTLTGAGIAYTTPTSVTGGTLRLQDADNFASSQVTLAANSTLELSTATTLNFATPISGAGNFTKAGTGFVTLNNPLGNTGTVTVRQGTLGTGGPNLLAPTGRVNVGGSGVAVLNLFGNDQTIGALGGSRDTAARIVGGGGTATLTVNLTGGTNVYGGTFGGPEGGDNDLAVRKQGAGTLVLTGTSTNTGGLIIEAGKIMLAASGTTIPIDPTKFSVWLDGADPNATGVAPANGAPISAWKNKGTLGAEGDFTAPTGREPSYVAGAQPLIHFTATPTVDFAAQGDYDRLQNTMDLSTGPVTIIVAGRYGGANNDERKRMLSALTNNWLLGWWNHGVNGAYYDGSFLPAVQTPDTNFHTYTAIMRGDGTGDTYSELGRIGGGVGRGPIGLGLGGGANYTTPNTENSTGDFGELFIYRGVIPDDDRAALEAYLARKWTGFTPTNPLSTTGSVTLLPGATLDVNGANQTIGTLNAPATATILLGGGRLLAGNDGNDFTFSGQITGPGAFGKAGPGTMTITTAQTYTGTSVVEDGVLNLTGGPNRLPVTAALALGSATTAGTLRLNGNAQTVAGLSAPLNASAAQSRVINDSKTKVTFTVNIGAGFTNYSGGIGGATDDENNLDFRKEGVGLLALQGKSTYSGSTVIAGGTLKLGGERNLPTVPLIWLDAADGATISTSASGVIGWKNKGSAGASGDFAAQGGAEPSYVLSEPAMGGNPVVHFDATGLQDRMVNSMNFANNVTVAYIGRLTGGADQRLVSATGNNWLLGTWGGNAERAYFNNWLYEGVGADTQVRFHYGTVGADGSAAYYSNGVLKASAGAGFTGPNGLSLGGGYFANPNTEYSNGDIGELFVFNGVLNDAQRSQLEAYIAFKWAGLTATDVLPSTTAVSLTSNTSVFDLNGAIQTIGSLTGVADSSVTLNGGFLTVGDSTSTVFAGSMSGKGQLIKTGSGTLEMSGTSVLTGESVLVQGGTLLVSGSLSGTAMEVQADSTLTGSGTVGGKFYLIAGGKLKPGNAIGTLTLTGTEIDLSDGVFGPNTGSLLFDLGNQSDLVNLTNGKLNIGDHVLEFNDFRFSTGAGFVPGTYVLFDSSQPIVGTLGAGLTGTVGGFNATLATANSNQDLVLTVVPEPGSAFLLLGGLALIASCRRQRIA